MRSRRTPVWRPSADQMKHWPAASGNAINGVGEETDGVHRQSIGMRQKQSRMVHCSDGSMSARATATQLSPRPVAIGNERSTNRLSLSRKTPAKWQPTNGLRTLRGRPRGGADDVGVAPMRTEYVFEGFEVPKYQWMIVIAVEQAYDAIEAAPSMRTLIEVTRQYARGTRAAKRLASWLRRQGQEAFPYGGPMAGSFVLISAAIEAGLGELGKHGSMIHPRFGSNFRLACVLTNAPLVADGRKDFGATDFCARCHVCSNACPPNAIGDEKTLVRGERRWYVDFDKCLPYFNEAYSCAICLAVCPFSRPNIGVNLVQKLAARRSK